jgi:hypothetical protein
MVEQTYPNAGLVDIASNLKNTKKKLVVTKAYTANDKQVRLQGHTESDTKAHTKIFVQKI